MKEKTQQNALVSATETTAELIPGQTADLIEKSFAENTLRNRRHALQKFREWLQGRQITDGLLAEYITHLFDIGKAPGTISIVVSAVKWFLKHRNGGTPVELPITSATLSGIRREGKDRGRGQRNGLTWREVEKICAVQEADSTLRGIRNSAILRVMSDGLLRISEVTELRISDLEDNALRIRFSKTDQEGQGEHLYLCEDTRQIVGEWLKRSGLTQGYLFRRMTARGDSLYQDKNTNEPSHLTDDGVRRIIKSCAARVGLTDMETKIPVFGICRGIQIMSVVMGGSLFQHIPLHLPLQFPDFPIHKVNARDSLHKLTIQPDSLLNQITSERIAKVNSRHHQAVKVIGEGFVVSAQSKDGVIEAIENENPSKQFVLGVQYHPERMLKKPELKEHGGKLFKAFIKAASQ